MAHLFALLLLCVVSLNFFPVSLLHWHPNAPHEESGNTGIEDIIAPGQHRHTTCTHEERNGQTHLHEAIDVCLLCKYLASHIKYEYILNDEKQVNYFCSDFEIYISGDTEKPVSFSQCLSNKDPPATAVL